MSDEQLGEEQETEGSIHHDDIVRRLLEYQRWLREGASPHEAAERAAPDPEPPLIDYPALERESAIATHVDEVVDLSAAEVEAPAPWSEPAVVEIPEAEPALETPAPSGDLEGRVDALEQTLRALAMELHDLRSRSQDYALLVDDRLAAIQDMVARAVGDRPESS